ncbi:MAG TPA: PAS domain-containing sensor histidine kinase [Candidatus Saccharimonadales bacterium]|nr:PAS domain-containing sensor histidine kinase [Candidatus Saccharimonadales bacterium]
MSTPKDHAAIEMSASEQEAKAEALFQSIGDGAISTDEFGRITRINRTARHILGYNKKELIGEWFPKKIVMVDDSGNVINMIDRPITKAFLTGKPIYQKAYYRRKNGQKIPVSINVSPILVHGKPLGAIEVFRDISFEEEVDRVKSEFISLASHQLRTPLSSIKTYTHMLKDGYMGPVSEPQAEALQTIVNATDRMNELISTLLNITRMESGAIATSLRDVRIDNLAEEVVRELSVQATNKGLKVTVSVSGKQSNAIRTDRTILKEIIINLVSNAIKYTPAQGSVAIKVRLRKKEIVVQVSDTGWGIPKYSQDQIFSKFFRAENITRRETTGTGLGLYLVRGLVDSINGKIWFESNEGQGTDFFLSLPRGTTSVKNNTPKKK